MLPERSRYIFPETLGNGLANSAAESCRIIAFARATSRVSIGNVLSTFRDGCETKQQDYRESCNYDCSIISKLPPARADGTVWLSYADGSGINAYVGSKNAGRGWNNIVQRVFRVHRPCVKGLDVLVPNCEQLLRYGDARNAIIETSELGMRVAVGLRDEVSSAV